MNQFSRMYPISSSFRSAIFVFIALELGANASLAFAAASDPVSVGPPLNWGNRASTASATHAVKTPVTVAVSDDYQLGPEDVVGISVVDAPDFSGDNVPVSARGRLDVPGVGEMPASGKTLRQMEAEIANKLRRWGIAPRVSLVLRLARPQRVFLVGAIKAPGVYELKPGWRISDMLAQAGGLADGSRPELIEVVLNRGGAAPVVTTVAKLLAALDKAPNVQLMAGDSLRLTEQTIRIIISGPVKGQGVVIVPRGSTAVDALALAGGAEAGAALSRASITRAGGKVVPVNLYNALVLGEQSANVVMQEGDSLVVPEVSDHVLVQGAVQKPGMYDMPDGKVMTAGEAFMVAGGVAQKTGLTLASVRRKSGEVLPVNLYKVTVQGDKGSDVQLQPGDTLQLPETHGVVVLGGVQKPGTYYIEAGQSPRLSDLLSMAGGLNSKPEDSRLTISRLDSSQVARTLKVDPLALLEKHDESQNVLILDGDTVNVAATKTRNVFVSGEVKSPGYYILEEGEGLGEALLRAGSTTPLAALTKVSIKKRNGNVVAVDASNVSTTPDVPGAELAEGDFVTVPKIVAKVMVMNAVARPGYYPFPENGDLSVGDAVNLAGGTSGGAKLNQVAIFHHNNGAVTSRIIALDKIMNGKIGLDEKLQPGDVIYVPSPKQSGSVLQKLTSAMSAAVMVRGLP